MSHILIFRGGYFLSEVWIYGGVADARAATIAVIVQLAAELGA